MRFGIDDIQVVFEAAQAVICTDRPSVIAGEILSRGDLNGDIGDLAAEIEEAVDVLGEALMGSDDLPGVRYARWLEDDPGAVSCCLREYTTPTSD